MRFHFNPLYERANYIKLIVDRSILMQRSNKNHNINTNCSNK